MAKLEQLEDQIRELSAGELRELRAWFGQFDSEVWDQQIEADIAVGKLDHLAERALNDHAAGLSKEI